MPLCSRNPCVDFLSCQRIHLFLGLQCFLLQAPPLITQVLQFVLELFLHLIGEHVSHSLIVVPQLIVLAACFYDGLVDAFEVRRRHGCVAESVRPLSTLQADDFLTVAIFDCHIQPVHLNNLSRQPLLHSRRKYLDFISDNKVLRAALAYTKVITQIRCTQINDARSIPSVLYDKLIAVALEHLGSLPHASALGVHLADVVLRNLHLRFERHVLSLFIIGRRTGVKLIKPVGVNGLRW